MHHRPTALLLCVLPIVGACATVTSIESPEEPVATVVGHPPALPPVPAPPPGPPPPPPPPKAVVAATEIELRAPVEFAEDEATLADEARPVLDAVAILLEDNPWILKLSVEVHANGPGSERSQRERAMAQAAVVQAYLMHRGIDAERIATVGHASAEPDRPLELLIVEGQLPETDGAAEAEVQG
ncbi:MAG: OmpA family protein [Myxococcota bacterium]